MTGHKSSTICGVAEWAEDQKLDLYLVSVWLIHVHKFRFLHAPGDKEWKCHNMPEWGLIISFSPLITLYSAWCHLCSPLCLYLVRYVIIKRNMFPNLNPMYYHHILHALINILNVLIRSSVVALRSAPYTLFTWTKKQLLFISTMLTIFKKLFSFFHVPLPISIGVLLIPQSQRKQTGRSRIRGIPDSITNLGTLFRVTPKHGVTLLWLFSSRPNLRQKTSNSEKLIQKLFSVSYGTTEHVKQHANCILKAAMCYAAILDLSKSN